MKIKRDAVAGDDYSNKLMKILPAELTATYFVIRSLAEAAGDVTDILMIMTAILCVTFYFIADKIIDLVVPFNKLLYCMTFLIWVAAIDADKIAHDIFEFGPDLASKLVFVLSATAAIWSFAVPYILKARGEQ